MSACLMSASLALTEMARFTYTHFIRKPWRNSKNKIQGMKEVGNVTTFILMDVRMTRRISNLKKI